MSRGGDPSINPQRGFTVRGKCTMNRGKKGTRRELRNGWGLSMRDANSFFSREDRLKGSCDRDRLKSQIERRGSGRGKGWSAPAQKRGAGQFPGGISDLKAMLAR